MQQSLIISLVFTHYISGHLIGLLLGFSFGAQKGGLNMFYRRDEENYVTLKGHVYTTYELFLCFCQAVEAKLRCISVLSLSILFHLLSVSFYYPALVCSGHQQRGW